MRGEHKVVIVDMPQKAGSSPHARGAPRGAQRFSKPPRDHPRMRGEHFGQSSSARPRLGSSPHARGALRVEDVEVGMEGIIPACAGSTTFP